MSFSGRFLLNLFFLMCFALQLPAAVHTAFFRQLSKADALANPGWTYQDGALTRIDNGEEQGRNKPIMIYDPDTKEYRDYEDYYCISLKPGASLLYKSDTQGIKWLEFNFAPYNDGDPADFIVEIMVGDYVVASFDYKGSADDFPEGASLVKSAARSFDGINDVYTLRITNRSKALTRWGNVLFWNFRWEDCVEAGPVDPGDDNLEWSQVSGRYLNGTVVFVSGLPGASLALYSGETLVCETVGAEGMVPTLWHRLDKDSSVGLRAVSGEVVSLHNFVTADDGDSPVPAISLNDGEYAPGSRFVATGVPGKSLNISYKIGNTTIQEQLLSDGPEAPVGELQLPGRNGEKVEITLEADGSANITRSCLLYSRWSPSASVSAIDLQDINSLYAGYYKVADIIGTNQQLGGLRLSNTPGGTPWLLFNEAKLVSQSGNSYVVMSPNSTVTVGFNGSASLRPEYVGLVQKEALEAFTPGIFNYDSGFPVQLKQTNADAREETFTASRTISLLGAEIEYQRITSAIDYEIHRDEPDPLYYDLQGRPLRTAPAAGPYIERKSGTSRLVM